MVWLCLVALIVVWHFRSKAKQKRNELLYGDNGCRHQPMGNRYDALNVITREAVRGAKLISKSDGGVKYAFSESQFRNFEDKLSYMCDYTVVKDGCYYIVDNISPRI